MGAGGSNAGQAVQYLIVSSTRTNAANLYGGIYVALKWVRELRRAVSAP